MIREDLLGKIQAYFSGRDDTDAVYLFGSQAKGKVRQTSDIDLAVLFTDNYDSVYRFRLKLRITNDLEDLLASEVDLVDLRSADLLFIHQIMLHKLLVYERDKCSRIAFEVAARKRYFDYMPIRERYCAQARKRLLERETKYHGR